MSGAAQNPQVTVPEQPSHPNFAEFMSLVQADDPENPLMIDADLWEDIFGDGTTTFVIAPGFVIPQILC